MISRTKLLIAPHDDDTELFAAFTVIREQPRVLIVFDSFTQANRGNAVTREDRIRESIHGLSWLGCGAHERLGLRDDLTIHQAPAVVYRALEKFRDENTEISEVWFPQWAEDGHAHHNAVAIAAASLFDHVTARNYLTYTTEGKQTDGELVEPQHGSWIWRKLQAMACHKSQMEIERLGCAPHFMRGLEEYYERV